MKFVGKKTFGWRLTYDPDNTEWDIYWTDMAVTGEQLVKMQQY